LANVTVPLPPQSTGRAGAREALLRAVDAVPGDDAGRSFTEVARRLPIPAGIDLVVIRLRDTDAEQLFHLVAMEGASPRERRARALHPLSIGIVKALGALGTQHTLARALGLRWQAVEWIYDADEAAGVLVAGSRTERRPTEQGRRLIQDVCAGLGPKLAFVERTHRALMEMAHSIAREAAIVPDQTVGEFETLRPRERVIVALYAEGLAVDDIARLLVISPHTVRTHVKNAFRRLGVHSREEAAQLLFASELRALI
jgi:DNA-binding CsgD family transcriptional regulator